jgi:hypothetical protein
VLLTRPGADYNQEHSSRLAVVPCELTDDRPEWAGLRALLIRPDGYVAWAAHESGPLASLPGPPTTPPLSAWLS